MHGQLLFKKAFIPPPIEVGVFCQNYDKCLLNKGLATIETIRQEYYDYEDRGIEWMKSPDKISYLNAQAAMKEILEEASIKTYPENETKEETNYESKK